MVKLVVDLCDVSLHSFPLPKLLLLPLPPQPEQQQTISSSFYVGVLRKKRFQLKEGLMRINFVDYDFLDMAVDGCNTYDFLEWFWSGS